MFLLLFLGRNAILATLASLLIVSQADSNSAAMLILTGDSRFDVAARFVRQDASHRIILQDPPPGRLVRLKFLPSDVELGRKELLDRGVPEDRIDVISWSDERGSLVAGLAQWLDEHPNGQVTVACGAFSSRNIRWSLDRSLSPDLARRLVVQPLPSPSYTQHDWWHSKRGVRAFVRGWASLVLPLVHRHRKEWRECNPELFQPAL